MADLFCYLKISANTVIYFRGMYLTGFIFVGHSKNVRRPNITISNSKGGEGGRGGENCSLLKRGNTASLHGLDFITYIPRDSKTLFKSVFISPAQIVYFSCVFSGSQYKSPHPQGRE